MKTRSGFIIAYIIVGMIGLPVTFTLYRNACDYTIRPWIFIILVFYGCSIAYIRIQNDKRKGHNHES